MSLNTVIRSLSFGENRSSCLREIEAARWPQLLQLTDASQLTLPLGVRCRASLPASVQKRIDVNLEDNAERQRRVMQAYREIAGLLNAHGIEFLVLKGFTNWPDYACDLRYRPQYDVDLYCPAETIADAYEAVRSLGYEPFRSRGRVSVDHFPTLIRMNSWRFRGDYYDPELPVAVELHFRLWDSRTEAFDVPNAEQFWERRRTREILGLTVPALDPGDALSYSTWHLVRHLVRGDLRAYHVYELAYFLHHSSRRDDFWREWKEGHPSRAVEAVAFRLAIDWFECRANTVVWDVCGTLSATVRCWFDLFAHSPATALERPNKDELYLHLCLVEGWRRRLQVTTRRLLPLRFDPVVADAHVPSPDWRLRLKRRIVSVRFMAQRFLHHTRTLAPLIGSGIRWCRALSARSFPP